MYVCAISSSAIDERISGSARCWITRRAIFTVTAGAAAILPRDLPRGVVERVVGDDAGHHAVRVGLGRVHRPAGEDHVAGDAVPAHLEQAPDATGVGDHAVGDLGQHEARVLGRDPDVAEQRALERGADRPALDRDDDRRVEVEDLLHAPMALAHQLVVRHLDFATADGGDVAPRRERLPLTPPDHRPHVGSAAQLAEDLPEATVHRVVERVALLRVVVGDHRDRAVVFEPDLVAATRHRRPPHRGGGDVSVTRHVRLGAHRARGEGRRRHRGRPHAFDRPADRGGARTCGLRRGVDRNRPSARPVPRRREGSGLARHRRRRRRDPRAGPPRAARW